MTDLHNDYPAASAEHLAWMKHLAKSRINNVPPGETMIDTMSDAEWLSNADDWKIEAGADPDPIQVANHDMENWQLDDQAYTAALVCDGWLNDATTLILDGYVYHPQINMHLFKWACAMTGGNLDSGL